MYRRLSYFFDVIDNFNSNSYIETLKIGRNPKKQKDETEKLEILHKLIRNLHIHTYRLIFFVFFCERKKNMLKNVSRRVQAEMGGGADDGWGKIMKLAKNVTLNLGQGFPDFVPSTFFSRSSYHVFLSIVVPPPPHTKHGNFTAHTQNTQKL
tara:strand:- start:266 stop:721 length:456 start_codon:yes stop_codon:yes gene_type:complete